MTTSHRDRDQSHAAAASAMLMLQLAASHAEIGPFACRSRETPQVAARLYRTSAALSPRLRPARVA